MECAGLEERLESVLDGGGLLVTDYDVMTEELKAVTLRKTVCYIVCAVIFNTQGEVLMVQEVKQECYGCWYLPAGRMEVGESIEEALQREVREEAGVECELLSLLLVQEQGPKWIRFTFLAHITGGHLKTEAEADSESLQAQWWDRDSPLPLRSGDIRTLIDAGLRYRQEPWFPVCLPVDLPCELVCVRLLLTFISPRSDPQNPEQERVWVLVNTHTTQLPVGGASRANMAPCVARRLLQECTASSNHALTLHTCGILGVQHKQTGCVSTH